MRLLSLQNADGGWHESIPDLARVPSTRPASSSGRCCEIGLPRDHPALAKALRYLLAQQQDFGGWFQTTTHENFRTPMRETRYAVMALAEAFPRSGGPRRGWGNRDDGPAQLPRTDSLVHTLDDLENLWDVPQADRARFARAIDPLLDHPEPLVRAAAAACLGRLGQARRRSAAGRAGSAIRPRSSGARRPGRCDGWAIRAVGLDEIRDGAAGSRPRSPPGSGADLRLPVPRDGRPARPGRVA